MRTILLVMVAAVSACGTSSASNAPASSSPAPTGSPIPVTIAVATNPQLGKILVDGAGRTVYLFAADKGTTSTCYADCAAAWPPVITKAPPQAGTGVTASLLGTTNRTDGSVQVTYNGHPLYYWIADKNPGDTTGQTLNNFGGAWYVVSPSGKQIGG